MEKGFTGGSRCSTPARNRSCTGNVLSKGTDSANPDTIEARPTKGCVNIVAHPHSEHGPRLRTLQIFLNSDWCPGVRKSSIERLSKNVLWSSG